MELKLDLHIHSERSPDGRMTLSEIVERAKAAAEHAMLTIGVFDGSRELTQDDMSTLELIRGAQRAIAVINKTDLPAKIDAGSLTGFEGPVI